MAQDFSFEPFFDDYSEDNKFHRILFRPGYAVQARELTQLQTILQEQIRRHGDHIFKEGSMVIPGQISYDLNLSYVQLSFTAGTNADVLLASLVGKEVKNASGLIAKVITYTSEERVGSVTEPYTLYVKYMNSTRDLAGNNVSVFALGETLSPVDGSSGVDVTILNDVSPGMNVPPIGVGSSASIERGVYYISKNFVLVQAQTIILNKYNTTPSHRIGLKLVEDVVYPDTNEQLLDNALGSPNYAAPGAARYFMDLQLIKVPLNSIVSAGNFETGENYTIVTAGNTDYIGVGADSNVVGVTFTATGPGSGTGTALFNPTDSQFIDLLRIENGKVLFKIDRTQYAELEKTLARRTYDESGDYALSSFNIQVKEYRNNLRGDWAASEDFIQGDLIKAPFGTGFLYFVAVTNGTTSNARPIFSNYLTVDNFVDGTVKWEHIEYPDFNGGVYTFTAGSADYASLTLNDHIRLGSYLTLAVEPGKAYVRGYEIEKIATEYLVIEKSREMPAGSNALCAYFGLPNGSLPAKSNSLSSYKTADLNVSLGSYLIVNSASFAPDVATFSQIELHSVAHTSAGSGTVIGKARIRGYERHETGSFKVFLFDIIMNSGKEFKNVLSIINQGVATSFRGNIVRPAGVTVTSLYEPANSSAIFQLPNYAIADIAEIDYTVVGSFTATSSGAGAVVLTAPTGTTFAPVENANNYIVIKNTDGSLASPTLVRSGSGATFTASGLTNTTSYTILATLEKSNSTTSQNPFTVTDNFVEYKTQAEAQAKELVFANSYVTRIVSVFMSANAWGTASPVYSTNISNRYTFIDGQDTSKIGASKLVLASGATAPTGPIRIKYEYLATNVSTGQTNLFAVGSYLGAGSGIRYDQIPTVSNYQLRDCVDFRPIWNATGFVSKFMPKYGTTASFLYRNYLSRMDNVSLSYTGDFIVNQGIPAERIAEPNTPNACMKLARISLEPYTFRRDASMGAVVDKVENKRYTMRDIGKLERRISDLEYYTALTLTELETKNMRIVDADGFERYQNGFLVDSFDGQGIGNASSDDWNASIDTQKKELRPFFAQKQVSLLENVAATTRSYKVSGDLVTLPFTETNLIIQDKASKTENVNPFALYSWKGILDINPWSDTWFSTHYRPDIIINDESQYNAIVAKAEADGVLGTVWNSWQVAFSSTKSLGSRLENLGAWSTADTQILNANNNGGSFWRNRATFTAEELDFIGNTNRDVSSAQATSVAGSRVLTIETQAIETTATRTGTRSFITDRVDSRVVEDRVVDTRIVPYIRPRAVLFTGFGFKPSTKMYGFFDNINVNDYVTPATRLEFTPITGYPFRFDTERNAGSAVSNAARTVYYNDGTLISGTVYINNGSTTLNGIATSFLGQVTVGDTINLGLNLKRVVASITSNTVLVLTQPYYGPIVSEADAISAKVISPKYTTEEVEVAFNHGEVIKEYVGETPTGNTAIVVGQEIVDGKYYVYVLNVKGGGNFSTGSTAQLRGEYLTAGNSAAPRIKFLAKTEYSALESSGTGQLAGIFRIPSSPLLKFRTGTRELRFSDSPANTPAVRDAQESTSGGAFYEAKGLIEINQRTIIASRTANVVSTQVSGTNTVVTTNDRLTRDTGWFDPLAETFMVQQEGGAFLTSVDIFFKTRDLKVPVRVEIREVVNGYPGSAVLPFSRVEKKGEQVLLSDNGSVATTFNFSSPVFVQNGVEYALVVLSDSNNYNVFIAQTDTIDLISQSRILTQPYNGVLFKSQNGSTWTADQTQDLKFTIRRAAFSQTPVTIELIPPPLGYTSLPFNPFNFITGSKVCRVTHPNHGMVEGEKVMFKSRQVVDSINGILASSIFDTELTIANVELNSYVVTFGGSIDSTATGQVGGGYIAATENYEFSTAMIEIAEVVPAGTAISYKAKVIDHADVVTEHDLIVKENYDFDAPKVYPSSVNYTSSTFPSGLSIVATLTPSSTLNSISPVIDLGRLAMTMVSNKVDSPTIANTTNATLDVFPITTAGTTIGTGQPFQLLDLNDDTVKETLVVNSTTQATLYNNMNNNLQVGDVIRFTYSDIVDAARYMIIVSKSTDATGNLYLQLEGETGETVMETSGNTVMLAWMSHFKAEYAAIGGSTHSKYVTKKINFSRPSEMLKIMFSAIIPPDAEVEVYYKTGRDVDGDFIASRYFKAPPKGTVNKSSTEFTEITCEIENLAIFDSVVVKLVMKSINTAKVPRIKDFRVIACAA